MITFLSPDTLQAVIGVSVLFVLPALTGFSVVVMHHWFTQS